MPLKRKYSGFSFNKQNYNTKTPLPLQERGNYLFGIVFISVVSEIAQLDFKHPLTRLF